MTFLERLSEVPALAGRVQKIARLAELQQLNRLPQATPAAFVLGSGLRGGPADAASTIFRQAIDRVTSVMLFVRIAGDATGKAVADEMDPLVEEVINRICGWGPDTAIGVHRLMRGEMIGFPSGMGIYQLDFILDDQLRIIPS